nr:MAG TPA: hypothetical protein [Caudoviricetes sp.]
MTYFSKRIKIDIWFSSFLYGNYKTILSCLKVEW